MFSPSLKLPRVTQDPDSRWSAPHFGAASSPVPAAKPRLAALKRTLPRQPVHPTPGARLGFRLKVRADQTAGCVKVESIYLSLSLSIYLSIYFSLSLYILYIYIYIYSLPAFGAHRTGRSRPRPRPGAQPLNCYYYHTDTILITLSFYN